VDRTQLRYFREAARCEHISKAAEHLGISQPTLSRSIAQLESQYGAPLFDRHGRTVRLNALGQALLHHVERALRALEDADRELADLTQQSRRTVALGFFGTLGIRVVPELLQRFQRASPNVEFSLYQGAQPALLDELRAGRLDICLCSVGDEQPDIIWEYLWSEPLFVHVPKRHPLATRNAVELAELVNEPIISLKPGSGLRRITDALYAKAGFSPRIVFEGEEVVTLRGLIGVGLGVLLAPRFEGPASDGVVSVPVSSPGCERPVGMAWLRGRYLSTTASEFRRFIIADAPHLNS
jgi:DNA-binding transcriptional LysR family regulator